MPSLIMLDFYKLAKQFPGVSEHLSNQVSLNNQRLKRASAMVIGIHEREEKLKQHLQNYRDRLIFSAAIPLEPLNTRIAIPNPANSHSVFACDGSQISPSQHESLYCYLINVGQVMLHYGQNLHPLLDSIPEIYYKQEDLYLPQQWRIPLEDWMSYQRTVSEAQVLSSMACNWVRPPGAHNEPNLAMVDGPLIYRFLDEIYAEPRQQILSSITAAWEQLRLCQIPFMGYISASRSMETVNFLRLSACSYDIPNCMATCSNRTEKPSCQVIDPLRDTTLWGNFLAPGERGAIWQSTAKTLEHYDEPFKVHFCYVNVGTEIARIEFPAWVVNNSALLERSLSIMLAQVAKGYGYPVALSEAHHQAVVKAGDRALFFSMIDQEMQRKGLKPTGISRKESRKRESIA